MEDQIPMRSAHSATRSSLKILLAAGLTLAGSGGIAAASTARSTSGQAFLLTLGKPRQVVSTVPSNGDINPYGIAVVPETVGKLAKGDTLVSNFNDKANVQGTGTTIMQVSPSGTVGTFATIGSLPTGMACPGGIGLTTALSILPGGWVVVGSLPTGAGGALPSENPAGCLIVLSSSGQVAETWSNANINGPWDMTAVTTRSGADLFVSNALSRPKGLNKTPPVGLCTVVRIDVSIASGHMPRITSSTVIGSNFVWRANKAALIQAPTGVALAANGTLYVAETVNSHITGIANAMTRTTAVKDGTSTLSSGGWLNGPLGLALAPNGDVIAMNGNDGNAVEINPQGRQVAKVTLVAHGAGDLFGVAIQADGHDLLFVNDGANAIDVASTR
jgi:hypothetical protein